MKNEKIQAALGYINKETTYLAQLDVDSIADSAEDLVDFTGLLEEEIRSEEIIYYSKALEFLGDEDPSLVDSLELAADLGYTPKNLNSEILATLLYQDRLMEELMDVPFDEF